VLLANQGVTRTTIDRVTLSGARPHVTRVLSLPPVSPIAFGPLGTQLLYVAGHSPPALWIGEVANGRLAHARRLIADSHVVSASF
jgi:hypothetical protein